jgi:hypothetical protein
MLLGQVERGEWGAFFHPSHAVAAVKRLAAENEQRSGRSLITYVDAPSPTTERPFNLAEAA